MRRLALPLLIGLVIVAIGVWVARNSTWTDVQIPTPPKGEALTNPFYAVQRFAEALGARTTRDRVLTIPANDSVVVLSGWHWSLSAGRRVPLERWVEAGGRLVVDSELVSDNDEFERWSGIVREYRDDKRDEAHDQSRFVPHPCDRFRQEGSSVPPPPSDAKQYWLCDYDQDVHLTTGRAAAWMLRDAKGIQAMRVAVGRGSVTVINASPFRYRSLFDGDHGWLFVAATELRRGDDVHFLTEENHPSLLALLWLYGRPVVLVALVLIALALWRGSVRLGPLEAATATARRSLAEQIRGTARFAMRHGGADALHAASVRALDEAARRRISGYGHLSAKERASTLASLTGFERDALAAAIYHPDSRRSQELRSTIGLLEAARRKLTEQLRSHHGTS